jgi:hypothetical protein
MPFTPTHTLAAVPLSRIAGVIPSALAIGCVAPDLPMFVRGTPSYGVTHSFLHGVPACLPFGVLGFVLFRLCRGPALGFAPLAVRRRLAHHAGVDLRLTPPFALSLLISVALGVLSHITWDGFTHANRFGSRLWPALMRPWLELAGHRLPGYEVLQHACSIVGLPLLAVVVIRWYRRQSPGTTPPVPPAPRALVLLACSLLAAIPPFCGVIAYGRALAKPNHFLSDLAYHAVTLTLAGYVGVALLVTLPQRVLRI